ncbi:MAG: site-specific integrase [Planctomycetes bacterium]|nr:site-specific integrase [Planctomycetota bacterium]
MTSPPRTPTFATLVREFFCDRLINQQNVSPHTVAAYRDSFRLLLGFVRQHRRKSPATMSMDDIDAPTVLAFLDDLEAGRHNSVRTRNARLATIRAFVTYASSRDPTALPVAQRVLAIPAKRFNRPLLGHLTRPEVEAVLNAPDRTQWSGRRDRVLFTLMYNTGARVSEAIGLCRSDLTVAPVASIRIRGKGRKNRVVPLWKSTASLLTAWLLEVAPGDQTPLFPNRHGGALSRSGVEDRLEHAVSIAATHCPSLAKKNVSPHTLRHTTAMHLLQSGVDVTVIALWLGHESPETTHQYMEADVEMKRRVLNRLAEPEGKVARAPKADELLTFLEKL